MWNGVLWLAAQLCPSLCDLVDCSPPGSSVHGDSLGKNTGMGCPTFFQGIFPTQWSKPGLSHCSRILYRLSHQGSPEWAAYPSPGGLSNPGIKPGSLRCRWILHCLSHQGSPLKMLLYVLSNILNSVPSLPLSCPTPPPPTLLSHWPPAHTLEDRGVGACYPGIYKNNSIFECLLDFCSVLVVRAVGWGVIIAYHPDITI